MTRKTHLISIGLIASCLGCDSAERKATMNTATVVTECVAVTTTEDSAGGIIGRFSAGPDGVLAWTDYAIGNHLIIGTADSAFLVGREGDGPGEFRMITDIGWTGDTVWASDLRLQRFQMFSIDGRLLKSEALPSRATVAWTGTDTLVGFPIQTPVDSALPIVRLVLGSSELDTLALFRNAKVPPLHLSMPDGNAIFGPQPFAESATASRSPSGGRWCGVEPGEGASMRLACVAPDGRSLWDTTLQISLEPLEEPEIDETIDRLLGLPGVSREAVESAIHIPPYRPRIARALVADDGRIWLQRTLGSDSIAIWQRWSADGSSEPALSLAPRQRGLQLRGDTLYVAASDEDGIQHIQRCLLK